MRKPARYHPGYRSYLEDGHSTTPSFYVSYLDAEELQARFSRVLDSRRMLYGPSAEEESKIRERASLALGEEVTPPSDAVLKKRWVLSGDHTFDPVSAPYRTSTQAQNAMATIDSLHDAIRASGVKVQELAEAHEGTIPKELAEWIDALRTYRTAPDAIDENDVTREMFRWQKAIDILSVSQKEVAFRAVRRAAKKYAGLVLDGKADGLGMVQLLHPEGSGKL